MSTYLDMPVKTLLNIPRIEITNHNEALIFGCLKITVYTAKEIQLLMNGYVLHMYGIELDLMTYSQGVIKITGNIKMIKMLDLNGTETEEL